MKTISLTDEQYKHLVKLAFIGEWILNAQNVGIEFKEEAQVVQYLYSNSKNFGLTNWFNSMHDEWELKEDFVFGITPVIDEYCDNEFWPILIEKLVDRDLKTAIALNKISNEEDFEYFIENQREKYIKEFEANEIDNLQILKSNNPSLN